MGKEKLSHKEFNWAIKHYALQGHICEISPPKFKELNRIMNKASKEEISKIYEKADKRANRGYSSAQWAEIESMERKGWQEKNAKIKTGDW